MKKLIAFITLLSFNVNAQLPTVVYGQSQLPDGKKDTVLLVQPENTPNPLGNPIVDNNIATSQNEVNSINAAKQEKPQISNQNSNQINQISLQNPPPFSETPQDLNNKIENTLYQDGNRIYDIQSYPIKDIDKITEPNINPTSTDDPDY